MFSVASLLNPVKPEPRSSGTPLPSSPSLSLYTSSSTHGSPHPSTASSTKKTKMSKDGAVFAKGKAKGDVNYPPFEDLDEETRRDVQRFQVYPLGKIQQYCRHIPYNSEKKSFLEKTGRESFEVFQYIFKVPGDDKDYTVMWDYNIGLVRITPFFKCCKYSKTTPAKMLNMNPGLKDITHSITGGALAAQGYWMPYSCALLVCATFCSHIAPALIPIFGPSFPSLCVPPEAPEHGRMIIDSSTILSATADAEAYRMQYQNAPSHQIASQQAQTSMRNTPASLGRSLRLKGNFAGESSFTDTDNSSDGGSTYFHSPATPNSSISLSQPHNWRPSNHIQHNTLSQNANSAINISQSHPNIHPHAQYKPPNPILSAIPRSIGMDMSNTPVAIPMSMSGAVGMGMPLPGTWRAKRRVEELEDANHEDDVDYDGGEESIASLIDEKMSVDEDISGGVHVNVGGEGNGHRDGSSEKRAAWLLMNLSVKDGEFGGGGSGGLGGLGGVGVSTGRETFEGSGRRIKRRRATSM